MAQVGVEGQRSRAAEVLGAFLRLGVTSFGGPVAHIGYFRTEFVERRRWISAEAFGQLVALCQFLPGPASSQTGFALGLMRAGWLGGLAAWAGFTLPSALLMVLFAWLSPGLTRSVAGAGLLHGLRLVAVAIVAQAVWGMARTLCPDRPRAGIALGALIVCSLAHGAFAQIGAIALGAAAGLWLHLPGGKPGGNDAHIVIGPRLAAACLVAFGVLLLAPPGLFAAFYRSGALVFGGGHVVLPLLQDAVVLPGWVTEARFLDGYGAAQAMPGPLFTFAPFLGFAAAGLGGAILALAAIFLPGLLILCGVLPFWTGLSRRPAAQSAMAGINAAVVGLLAAALYSPVWTGGIAGPADFAIAAASFLLLTVWAVAPWVVVLLNGTLGLMAALLT